MPRHNYQNGGCKMMDHDELVRESFERLSNGVSRHRFLSTVAKGMFATIAALTVGSLEARGALASISCCSSTAVECSGCPGGTGPNCPNNYYKCLHPSSNCAYCEWSNGYWLGCNQTKYCTDCIQNGQCWSACTCQSA